MRAGVMVRIEQAAASSLSGRMMSLPLVSVSACAMKFRSVSPSAVEFRGVVMEGLGTEIGWMVGVGDHRAVRLADTRGVGVVDPISSCDFSKTPPR